MNQQIATVATVFHGKRSGQVAERGVEKTQVIFSDEKTEPIEEISKKKVEFTVFLQVGTIMIIWLDDNLYALDKLHLIPFSYFLRQSHAAFAL